MLNFILQQCGTILSIICWINGRFTNKTKNALSGKTLEKTYP